MISGTGIDQRHSDLEWSKSYREIWENIGRLTKPNNCEPRMLYIGKKKRIRLRPLTASKPDRYARKSFLANVTSFR